MEHKFVIDGVIEGRGRGVYEKAENVRLAYQMMIDAMVEMAERYNCVVAFTATPLVLIDAGDDDAEE